MCMSLALFEHLHALSLRWHLQRKTGEVLTVMNQGVSAVATLLQVVSFQISATLLELLLTLAVFFKIGVPAISLCIIGGAALYTVHTIVLTGMRTQQRREVNGATKKAQDAVVDSLLNFETVKLFACERPEAQRYDGLTRTLVSLQQTSQDSLSWLNWGQTGAMQLGMAGGLLVASQNTASGQMSVGDFVMVQLYIMQLFRPLANLGGNYRMLMQALTDVEKMAELLHVPVEVRDKSDAADLVAAVNATVPSKRWSTSLLQPSQRHGFRLRLDVKLRGCKRRRCPRCIAAATGCIRVREFMRVEELRDLIAEERLIERAHLPVVAHQVANIPAIPDKMARVFATVG